jgi:hypothetical protein
MLFHAITIFLSAFLLFQVQPMIAKMILPWFGGSAAVWATCLLFFQAILLAGLRLRARSGQAPAPGQTVDAARGVARRGALFCCR